jgi:transposase
VRALLEQGAVRQRSGRCRIRPARLARDTSSTGRPIRVERVINRLTQNRAIATRDDKLAVRYHAMLTLAAILCWR